MLACPGQYMYTGVAVAYQHRAHPGIHGPWQRVFIACPRGRPGFSWISGRRCLDFRKTRAAPQKACPESWPPPPLERCPPEGERKPMKLTDVVNERGSAYRSILSHSVTESPPLEQPDVSVLTDITTLPERTTPGNWNRDSVSPGTSLECSISIDMAAEGRVLHRATPPNSMSTFCP